MRPNKNVPARDTAPIRITAMVAALAASTLVGCSSSNRTAYNGSTALTRDALASRATVSLDSGETVGRYDNDYYAQRAAEIELPAVWLSEARTATADIEARRAAAQSERVRRDAMLADGVSRVEAGRAKAISNYESARAKAELLDKSHEARLLELERVANATLDEHRAANRLNSSLTDAERRDRSARFDAMRSQASRELLVAQSEHEKLIANRSAVETQGKAEITEMFNVRDQTQARSQAKIRALRTGAQSINEQTSARASELEQQIKSFQDQFNARSSELRTKAQAIENDSVALAQQLNARAVALTEADAESAYELAIKSGQLEFEHAQAEAEAMRKQVEAITREAQADSDRMREDANRINRIAQTEYDQQLSGIQTVRESGLAEVQEMLAEASRIETQARADFVAAEVEAHANAIREQSQHQNAIAEAQYKQLKADAERTASAIQAQVFKTIAQQTASGSVEFPGKTDSPKDPGATPSDPTPEITLAADIQPFVNPEKVASFKSRLAKVAAIRSKSDAVANKVKADFDDANAQLNAWLASRHAEAGELVARADAFERRAAAEASEMTAKADARLNRANAELDRSLAEAEAVRNDTFATIANLQAEAERVRKQGRAAATQLLATADANDRAGAAELTAMRTKLDSINRRGQAQASQFVAEADALEISQQALLAQMNEEINAAQRILKAELARLDQSAHSFLEVAQATYNEAVAIADAFRVKSDAEVARMEAVNEATWMAGKADVEHAFQLVDAQRIAADADVDRAIASADHNFSRSETGEAVQRAAIAARAEMSDAAIAAWMQEAGAMETAVASVFNARTIQTVSERNLAYADRYLSDQQTRARTEQAIAAAEAHRMIADQAMLALQEKSQSFQVAAQRNWDSRLAMPASQPSLPSADQIQTELANRMYGNQKNNKTNYNNIPEPTPFDPASPAFVNVPIPTDDNN